MTNNPNVTNVLNPKSLEKQIKIYETRLQILQAEVEELSRLKAACQLLLGTPPAGEATADVAEAKPAKAKKESKKDAKAEESVPTEEAAEAVDPAIAEFEKDTPPALEN